jgi:hypothetical protein
MASRASLSPRTYLSCSVVSMAPGRAWRTALIALRGGIPSSISRRAAIVPARPREKHLDLDAGFAEQDVISVMLAARRPRSGLGDGPGGPRN